MDNDKEDEFQILNQYSIYFLKTKDGFTHWKLNYKASKGFLIESTSQNNSCLSSAIIHTNHDIL
jgi:hypothetical protein